MTVLIAMLLIALYMFMAGVTFSAVAAHYADPACPWDTPGPFFAGIFWPCSLPLLIGASLTKRFGVGQNRQQKRMGREVDEALHKKRLAEIAAEELEVSERILFREVKYND